MEARDDVPLQQLSRETSTHEENEENDTFADQYEVPPYEGRDEEVLPPYEQRRPERIRSTPLHRNLGILIPVALYAAMAIFSWVTICILSRTEDYTSNKNDIKTRYYRAARTLQVVTNVATLPVISFVCAWAAAVFVQNQRDAYSLRLRQVVTLADRAWTNPMLYARLLAYPSAFKRYGSSMLYLAILIHIFGAITYPIQSLFLSTRLVSISPLDRDGFLDYSIIGVKSLSEIVSSGYEDASNILTVRQESQTLAINGYQDNLWGNTSQLNGYKSNSSWYAPLSRDTSTGLYFDQYIPRINCSAEVQNMTANEFPSNCAEDSLFYAAYTYPNSYYNLTVEVCLPGNWTQSPWQAIDSRQDFTEVLYVNIDSNYTAEYESQTAKSYFKPFKVIMNTTAGLFEMPNVKNGQIAGPLDSNSSRCANERSCNQPISRRENSLFDQSAIGPLATIALALFGPGSFADTQQTEPRYYTIDTNETGWKEYLDSFASGDSFLPLEPLGFKSGVDDYPIDDWIGSFSAYPADASSAFTQASYLAIKAMFDSDSEYSEYGGFSIYSNNDALEYISLPSMPFPAMIACSVLFGLYMVPLLCLALYAGFSHRWTDTLDAFTMLRMGAALGQKDLPLLIGKNKRKIEILDNLPGVVRDISGPDDRVRQLAFGIEGGAPLQLTKRYLAYPGNHDAMELIVRPR